jgi:hypothetical protein
MGAKRTLKTEYRFKVVWAVPLALAIIALQWGDYFFTIVSLNIVGIEHELNIWIRYIMEWPRAFFWLKIGSGLFLAMGFLTGVLKNRIKNYELALGSGLIGMTWICAHNAYFYLKVSALNIHDFIPVNETPFSFDDLKKSIITHLIVSIIFLMAAKWHKSWRRIWCGAAFVPLACSALALINFLIIIWT